MIPTHAPDYRPDIDGLRAVAILMVVVFHFELFPIGKAGFTGVDVFFVISGFLITRIILRGLSDGSFSFGGFYLARLRRLLPALMATLVLYVAVGWALFLPDRFAELSFEALLSQLYVINIYFWRSINYFGLQAREVPLLHMWSLAVEEQFYILYPITLAAIFAISRRLILPALILGTAGSFVLGWWATGWKPEAAFYLLPTRAWELLAGGLLACLATRPMGGASGAIAGLAGAALLVLTIVLHTPATPFPGWFAALPVTGAVLLILAGPETPTGRVLSTAPMIWIGHISYPLYLVHWPIIITMRETLEAWTPGLQWGGFLLSFLLAAAIYYLVETPVRRRRVLATPRRFLSAAALGTAAILAAGYLGWSSDGAPGRFSPEVRTLLAYGGDTPVARYGHCELSARRDANALCRLGREDVAPKVALLGDSHAQALAEATGLWLKDRGLGGVLVFHHGCLPAPGANSAGCDLFRGKAGRYIAETPGIETVMIVSAWRHQGVAYDGRYLEGEEADAAFEAALTGMLEGFTAAGKRVILVDPMHFAAGSVPERMARNLHFGLDWPINTPRAAYHAVFDPLFGIFDRAATHPKIRRVSLIGRFCDEATCRATVEGTPLFSDGAHLRLGLSPLMAEVIGNRVGSP